MRFIEWLRKQFRVLKAAFKQKEIETKTEEIEAKRRENAAKLINYKSGTNEKVHNDLVRHSNFDSFNVKDQILHNRSTPTLTERLNSLPLSRITDECKERVIELVEQDIKDQNDDTWERMKHRYDSYVDVSKEQENEDK